MALRSARLAVRLPAMPATLEGLLSQERFGLTRLHMASGMREAIAWVYTTDVLDPTQFLSDRLVIITSGQQFQDTDADDVYTDYVDRLAARGVLGIGFGTDVFRRGTPVPLIEACANADVTLFEIPYKLPFLAIIRWVSDILAKEALAQEEAALAAHQAVATAAITMGGGFEGALREFAQRMSCELTLFDEHGNPRLQLPRRSGTPSATRIEVDRLLQGNSRASSTVDEAGETTTLHTLGSRNALTGVLAIKRDTELNRTEWPVFIGAVAITEIALHEEDVTRAREMRLGAAILNLLLDRQISAAEALASSINRPLPSGPVHVLRVTPGSDLRRVREVGRGFKSDEGWFATSESDGATGFVAPSALPRVRAALRTAHVSGGLSEAVSFLELHRGLDQAERAAAASRGDVTEWRSAGGPGLWQLVRAESAQALSTARLAEIVSSPEGAQSVEYARMWFQQNCRWDPAAALLHIHRHTLRSRVESLAARLDLDLDAFSDRAELWLILTSADE